MAVCRLPTGVIMRHWRVVFLLLLRDVVHLHMSQLHLALAEGHVCTACLQAQYMPLESQEGANGEAAQPLRAASNGGVGTV